MFQKYFSKESSFKQLNKVIQYNMYVWHLKQVFYTALEHFNVQGTIRIYHGKLWSLKQWENMGI